MLDALPPSDDVELVREIASQRPDVDGQALHGDAQLLNCLGSPRGPLWLDFGTGTQADVLSSQTVANGVVYAGKNNGDVLAWGAGPCGQFVCNEIWHFTTKDPLVTSSPTVVNGFVYIGGSNNLAPQSIAGRLYVFGL